MTLLHNDDNHLWQIGDRAQHLFTGRYATIEKVGRKYLHVRMNDERLIRTVPFAWRFVGTVVL